MPPKQIKSKQQKQKKELFKEERESLNNIPYSTRLLDDFQWFDEDSPGEMVQYRRPNRRSFEVVDHNSFRPPEHNYPTYGPYEDYEVPDQWELSNQMSGIGSTLPSALASCGVLGCLGLGSYFLGRHHGKRNNQPHREIDLDDPRLQPYGHRLNPIDPDDFPDYNMIKREEDDDEYEDYNMIKKEEDDEYEYED